MNLMEINGNCHNLLIIKLYVEYHNHDQGSVAADSARAVTPKFLNIVFPIIK